MTRPLPETRRSIVLRIAAVTGVSLTVFVGVLLVARGGLETAVRDSRAAEEAGALAADSAASKVGAELQRARVAEYLIASDPSDMGEYWAMEEYQAERLRRLTAAFANDSRVQLALDRERAFAVQRRTFVNETFRLAPEGGSEEAKRLAQQSAVLTERSLAQIAVVMDAAEQRSSERLRASHEHLGRVRGLLVALGCGGLLLGFLLSAFLVRTVGRSFARVRKSEDHFRTLVANMPGAAYRRAADGDWSMSFVSERIRDICGHAAEDLMSGAVPYGSIVQPVERERVVERISALPPNGAFTIDYAITHADGDERWVREMGHAVHDRGGAIRWLDGTISDITQIKRLEDERERMEAELRLAQRLEAVGQLASGIAHEINTPIQFVGDSVRFIADAFTDLERLLTDYRALLDEHGQDPRVAQAEESADLAYLRERVPTALERTQDGVERVAKIVRAMRDFGGQTHEHAPADLNHALRSTLAVSANEYKYVADVETTFAELPEVTCNIGEINQLFLNLIVNAAHAIGDAGRHGAIRITTASAPDHAVVTISDDGPGIPSEIRDRIFDPFFTTKEVGRGTGQGLAIARSIVDKHAGTLSVESEPGQGATFTVRLPLEPASSAS